MATQGLGRSAARGSAKLIRLRYAALARWRRLPAQMWPATHHATARMGTGGSRVAVTLFLCAANTLVWVHAAAQLLVGGA